MINMKMVFVYFSALYSVLVFVDVEYSAAAIIYKRVALGVAGSVLLQLSFLMILLQSVCVYSTAYYFVVELYCASLKSLCELKLFTLSRESINYDLRLLFTYK